MSKRKPARTIKARSASKIRSKAPTDRRSQSNWHLYDWPMNNVQQAIRDAAEKGGYRYRWWKVNDLEHSEEYNGLQLRALSEHLHDPDFWKALATARKWEDANAWRFH